MNKANFEIRLMLFNYGIQHKDLAQTLGITPESLSRKLRYQLKDGERDYIISIIKKVGES